MSDRGKLLSHTEATGCPMWIVVGSGLLALAGGLLYWGFPAGGPIREALDEGAPIAPLILFGLILFVHIKLGGRFLGTKREGLGLVANLVRGRISPSPADPERLLIRGHLAHAPVEIDVRSRTAIRDDKATVAVQLDSPIRLQVAAQVEVIDNSERFEIWHRLDLDTIQCSVPRGELFARAPRLLKALRYAIENGAEDVQITSSGLTLILDGGRLNTPLAPEVLLAIKGMIEALQALRAAPQVLEPSFMLEARSPTTCPYCKDDLTTALVVSCCYCDTRHHQECFEELGRCTVLGCGGGASVPASVKA